MIFTSDRLFFAQEFSTYGALTGPRRKEQPFATLHCYLPQGQLITLPAATAAAIARSSAKYAAPLWHYRAERVLKLGAHQWIYPVDIATAHTVFALHPMGIVCLAWKLY